MDFDIRKLAPLYLGTVIKIHMEAFPGFFLSFLGPRFLKEFYRSFIEDSLGIGLVAVDLQTEAVVGVVVGPVVPAGYFKRLLTRKWWSFCLASLTAVLKKPSVVRRLFRAVFYRGDAPAGKNGLALLSSIAVSPDAQAKGIGVLLVRAFIKEVKLKGGKGVFLTTDADNNDKVNRFYQRIGFSLDSVYVTPEGRKMNRYSLIFDGTI